jgi:hypothetical protein
VRINELSEPSCRLKSPFIKLSHRHSCERIYAWLNFARSRFVISWPCVNNRWLDILTAKANGPTVNKSLAMRKLIMKSHKCSTHTHKHKHKHKYNSRLHTHTHTQTHTHKHTQIHKHTNTNTKKYTHTNTHTHTHLHKHKYNSHLHTHTYIHDYTIT